MMQEHSDLLDRIALALTRRTIKTLPEIRSVSRTAAVLVPIFIKNGEAMVLFTKRASNVGYHRGHVSFPGGVVDASDSGPQQTALREAWEEIGLEPAKVNVLGPLDDSMTYAPPFVIHPFVGAIPFPYPLNINTDEVEKIIEIPLATFFPDDTAGGWNYGSLGEERYFPEYRFREELIWGTTASIVANFVGILKRRAVFGTGS